MKPVLTWLLLCVSPVWGGDLTDVLGMDRRVDFATYSDRAPSVYGRPRKTYDPPDALLVPLQAANEGLAFYAAIRAKNYRAAAVVGAMSLWGGTLRRGIDAVLAGDRGGASVEDLAVLTEREIWILGYLCRADRRSAHDIYRAVPGDRGTWANLASELDGLTKRGLIARDGSGTRARYGSLVGPGDLRRAAIASQNPQRLITVLRATGLETPHKTEVKRGSNEAGDGAETQ